MQTPFHAITITVQAPAKMRYQTVGDWQVKDGVLVVTVAASGDTRSDIAVGIHEAVEAFLFLTRGGSEKAVDNFDETEIDEEVYDEHGDDPRAPYHREHVIGTIVERMLMLELGMTWEAHSENVERADEAVSAARKERR